MNININHDTNAKWLQDHQLVTCFVSAAIAVFFIWVFAFQLRDKTVDTFFTRLCKVWLILGLSIKFIFLMIEVYMVFSTSGQVTIFDTKFVIQNY